MSIHVKIAESSDHLMQFKKLLFQEYCQRLGWHDPSSFTDEVFEDEYDDYSTFLTVIKEEEVIGGLRIVHKSDAKNLPHEHEISRALQELRGSSPETYNRIKEASENGIGEITRAVGKRQGHKALIRFLGDCLYHVATHAKTNVLFAVVDLDMFKLAHRINIPLNPIGVPVFLEGSWTIPTVSFQNEILTNGPFHTAPIKN